MKMDGYLIIGLISLGILLFILLIIIGGFFIITKLGIYIFKNNNSIFGILFMIFGFFFMIVFSYITLGKYSKYPYSTLSSYERVFYTGIIYDKNYTKKYENGKLLAYDKEGNLFTGVLKTYFEKFRLSPFKAKENSIRYFINGYFMGSSQSPNESVYLSPIPIVSIPKNIDAPILIHKDYEKHLDEEIKNWGEYLIIDEDKTVCNSDYKIVYALCIKEDKIIKRKIAFYRNGVIASRNSYYSEKFGEWSFGGGNYLLFDSLGFLKIKDIWNGEEDRPSYSREFPKENWKCEDFIYKRTYSNILRERESKNKEFRKKIFYPNKPDFLKNSERWKKEYRNFDNFYLLFGGNPKNYKETVGIVVYVTQNWETKCFSLNAKTGEIFASALDAGRLITKAKEDPLGRSLYGSNRIEFVLFLNNKEMCTFLFKNDKFYMDNGIYAVSLSTTDAENDEHKFYMEQSKNELKNMLKEVIRIDVDGIIYTANGN